MFWNSKRKLVEYAEQEAKINAQYQIDCADSLQRSSSTLFTLLLSGAGGGLALSVSLFGNHSPQWLWLSVAAVSVYLFAIAGMLAYFCLQAQDLYPPANEPLNLYNDKNLLLGFYETRESELSSRQRCIDRNIERNNNVAYWLNEASLYATLTSLAFIAVAFFAYLLGSDAVL